MPILGKWGWPLDDSVQEVIKETGVRPCRSREEARRFLGQILVCEDAWTEAPVLGINGPRTAKAGYGVAFNLNGVLEVSTSVYLRWRTESGERVGVPV